MPLISKPNYNQIFASDAPAIDKPPVFSDKTKGWDVAFSWFAIGY